MRTGRQWSGSSRRLTVLFLTVAGPAAVTLVWLGLQLLQQDRSLWAQREMEARQAAAQGVIHFLKQKLAEAERRLPEDPAPAGMVRLTASSVGVEGCPAGLLLWVPVPPAMEAAESRNFSEAEVLEFQGAPGRALLYYDAMARSPSPPVRAGALLRLARVQRRQGKRDEALRAYRNLAEIRDAAIDGMPADLLARRAVCSVLEESGKKQELVHEAAALDADFRAGRWHLDRAGWEWAAEQITQWTGRPLPLSVERKALSAAADWLWDEWRRNRGKQLPDSKRQVIVVEEIPVTLLSRAAGTEIVAMAIVPSVVRTWTQHAMESDSGTGDRLSLVTPSGEVLAGPKPAFTPGALKLQAPETGLPWTLVFSPGGVSRQAREFAMRRRLLSLGLAAIVLLLAGASYLLWSVIQRELTVARLQTDFVSTVSHEFRTPLTSLRHVAELLEEDDDLPQERRKLFYAALGRNTERLQRLVESLLDFARMEGGRKPYQLQPLEAGELTARVVDDFRKEAGPRGFTIDLEVEAAGALQLRADAAALTHALWNLLDNAVKYSPERRAVRVSVRRHREGVAISVQDDGLGIPPHERKEIFRKFVRGEKAGHLGIRGTGLGLAMVSHIVSAHGGTIELETEEGAGSTFRLVLPELVKS